MTRKFFFPNLPSLVAAAALSLVFTPNLHAQGILSAEQLSGKKILIVAGEPEKDHTNDDMVVKKHLESQGYVVTMAKEEDDLAKAAGQDLIIISSTADPREIADKYASVSVPVFTWNTVDYPDMKMSGPERHVDFETLDPLQDYPPPFTMLYGYFPNVTNPIVHELGIPRSQLFGTGYLLPQAFGGARPASSAAILVNFQDGSN